MHSANMAIRSMVIMVALAMSIKTIHAEPFGKSRPASAGGSGRFAELRAQTDKDKAREAIEKARRKEQTAVENHIAAKEIQEGSERDFQRMLRAGTARRIDLGDGVSIDMIKVGDGPDAFFLGRYEVTQEQYRLVMGKNPSAYDGGNRDRHPVENLSLRDVVEFCKLLNTAFEVKTGGEAFSIPTRAEWEKAAMAGGETAYAGIYPLDEIAWYEDNSGKQTHEVGQKRPNGWGFHDMWGNVDEMYFSGDLSEDELRKGKSHHAVGGHYYSEARSCKIRSGCRYSPDSGMRYTGFRLAQSRSAPAFVLPRMAENEVEEQPRKWFESERIPSRSNLTTERKPSRFSDGSPFERTTRSSGSSSSRFAGLQAEAAEKRSAEERRLGVAEAQHQKEEEKLREAEEKDFLSKVRLRTAKRLELGNGVVLDLIQIGTGTRTAYLGRYEVTREQYKTVMGALPGNERRWSRDDSLSGRAPVSGVSWDDAMRFCEFMNKAFEKEMRGYTFSLPTVKEWVKAAKAHKGTLYSGSDNLDEVGWYSENAHGRIMPVGLKKPNAWGFHDMCGNVREWCLDEGERNPMKRTLCGGDSCNDKHLCRLDGRNPPLLEAYADSSYSQVGFRIIAVVDSERR